MLRPLVWVSACEVEENGLLGVMRRLGGAESLENVRGSRVLYRHGHGVEVNVELARVSAIAAPVTAHLRMPGAAPRPDMPAGFV